MIDDHTFCAIQAHHQERGLTPTQIAEALQLDVRTVTKWLGEERLRPRRARASKSKLDRHKPTIRRWLEAHRYSAQQVFQRLREQEGYTGGISIVKDYVRHVRPPRTPAFLTLSFAPGECAQVDWGMWDAVPVGETRRRLSLFVMVLCYSRMLYVEFTLSQSMEQFLTCHQNAFAFFGNRVPHKIMVDNLKSAVLKRISGEAPVFNPRYVDFANHYGFRIIACNKGKGNEKGRVESGVGYVKKNFLNALDISEFKILNPAAQAWMKDIANVREHGATHRRPVDQFAEERSVLQVGPEQPYDSAHIEQVRASSSFRVLWETNRYSVPAEYAGCVLTLKVYPDRLCVYDGEQLIARHARCWDRHQDQEDPDHPKVLVEQRRGARQQKLMGRFLALCAHSETYYKALAKRRLNPDHHVQKIVALSEIYGTEATARAMTDALEYQAFSSEYVANVLESRARLKPEPSALQLTRRQDLLELEMPAADLSVYCTTGHAMENEQ